MYAGCPQILQYFKFGDNQTDNSIWSGVQPYLHECEFDPKRNSMHSFFISISSIVTLPDINHVAKFYRQLWLIRSVLRASHFLCLKLIEILILWFITPSLLALPCFGTFCHHFSYFKLLWLRITDAGLVPKMRI